jgi:hypothetical protein
VGDRRDFFLGDDNRTHEDYGHLVCQQVQSTLLTLLFYIATQFLFLGGNALSRIGCRKLTFPTFPTFPTFCQSLKIENCHRQSKKTYFSY